MRKVKSITGYSVSKINEDIEKFKSSYMEYDADGNLIIAEKFDDEGGWESKMVSKYDAHNNLLEESNYITEDEIGDSVSYVCQENGDVIESTETFADGSTTTKKYDYQDKELIIEAIDDEDGQIDGRESFKFDSNKNPLEHITYDYNGKITERVIREFNEKNLVNRRIEYDGKKDRDMAMDRHYTYNENNSLLQIVGYSRKKKVIELIKLQYDDGNRVVEQQFNHDLLIKTTYDENANTQTELRYNKAGELIEEVVQTFNDDKEVIKEDTPFLTTEFEICYFD